MAIPIFLQTEDGLVITTEDGQAILVQRALTNDDVEIFDFSVNLLQALLWEYNDATNLQALLDDKNSWYFQNQNQFWTRWVADVFDLRTANDFGLSVWSVILNQPIYINNGPPPSDKPTWGFGAFHKNFTRGNFTYDNGYTYRLPTETARLLLRLRYFQLVSSGTVPETNRMLKYFFENYGSAYLLDHHDMTQQYIFMFPMPSQLKLILNNFDILPRPAGVESSYYQGAIERWGFGVYHANFNNGNFGAQ